MKLFIPTLLSLSAFGLTACGDGGGAAPPDLGRQPDADPPPARDGGLGEDMFEPGADAGDPSPSTGCGGTPCPSPRSLWSFGADSFDLATAVTHGSDGDLYVVGSTDAPLDFGMDEPTGDSRDLIVVRFSPELDARWWVRIEASSLVSGHDIAIEGDDLYVLASFAGELERDDTTLVAEDYDVLLMRFGLDGEYREAHTWGGPGSQSPHALALTSDGTPVVCGTFSRSILLGGETVTSAGGTDGFVAGVGTGGEVSWWRTFGGPGDDDCTDVAPDTEGGVIVAGHVDGSVEVDGTLLTAGSEYSPAAFLGSYGGGGVRRWVRGVGSLRAMAMAVALSPDGDVLVALDADSDTATLELEWRSASDGSLQRQRGWRDGIRGGGNESPREVAFDAAGNLYVAGSFADELRFATDIVLDSPSTSSHMDIFVVSFDPTGMPRWGHAFVGAGNDVVTDLAVSPSGGLTLAGYYADDLDFGIETASSTGSSDGFVLIMD